MIKKENVKHLLELMHFTTDDDNIYAKFLIIQHALWSI